MTLTYEKDTSPNGAAQSPRRRGDFDTLPELTAYRDEGCEVSPTCLECPLPRCKYDDPDWYRRLRLASRDARVLEALRTGRGRPAELARRFGVSLRTVQRIMKRARASPPRSPSPARRGGEISQGVTP